MPTIEDRVTAVEDYLCENPVNGVEPAFCDPPTNPRKVRVCVVGCSHELADWHNRGELPTQLLWQGLQSIGATPDYWIAHGDHHHSQTPIPPVDQEATDLIQQAIAGIPNYHTLAGNHDAGDGDLSWFMTTFGYVQHNRMVQIGNIAWLMLDDRNDLPYPVGRQGSPESGGHPDGCWTRDQFDWVLARLNSWHDQANVIVSTHSAPPNTVIATGSGDGDQWHGTSGTREWNGAHASIFDEATGTPEIGTPEYGYLLEQYNFWWSAGHTHYDDLTTVDPSGRGPYAMVNGCFVAKNGAINKSHNGPAVPNFHMYEFTEGSDEAVIEYWQGRGNPQMISSTVRMLAVPFDPDGTLPTLEPLPSWPPSSPPPVTQIVVDDQDAAFTHVGFEEIPNPSLEGFRTAWHRKQAGTGAGSATWSFSGLSDGNYSLFATWPPKNNRADDATFAANGELFTVNQQIAPVADRVVEGDSFELLGLVAVVGGALDVTLTESANQSGQVIADAVLLELAE